MFQDPEKIEQDKKDKEINLEHLDEKVDIALKKLEQDLLENGEKLVESLSNKFLTRKELIENILDLQEIAKDYEPKLKKAYLKMNKSQLEVIEDMLQKCEKGEKKVFKGVEVKKETRGRGRPRKNKMTTKKDKVEKVVEDQKDDGLLVLDGEKIPNLKTIHIPKEYEGSVTFNFYYNK